MMTIVFLIVGAAVDAAPAKEPPTRFSKRGPLAWEDFMNSPLLPLRDGGSTRLLVHAIGDAIALQWIPKVIEFLAAAKRAFTDLTLPDGLDIALAQYMDWQCYGKQRSPSAGTLLLVGLDCLLPEIKGKLPLAARSLKSWAWLAITAEGGPVPEEIIFLATIDLIESGHVYEGRRVRYQHDVYSRELDMTQLQGADVNYYGKTMGTDLCQGVLLRRNEVVDIMMAPDDATGTRKIFPITRKKLRQCWHRSTQRLGRSFGCPSQTTRHSGPPEDLARQRCSLEDVRHRGLVPEETRARATVVEADVRRALPKARSGERPSVVRVFLPRRIVVKADLGRAHQARDSCERARGTHGERQLRASHGERQHESDGLSE
jgi:hypothetical protein